MLSAVLDVAAQDTSSFGSVEVSVILTQGTTLRGTLVEVVSSNGADVVVLHNGDDVSFVPAGAISAARLHLDAAQEHRLRTGEVLEEDTYADHRLRCWGMGSELSEEEYDFASAEVELSIKLNDDGWPKTAIMSLLFDDFLDAVQGSLRRIIRTPASRLALIYGCPTVRIQTQDTDQCAVENDTIYIPVQVRGESLILPEQEVFEAQINALLFAQLDKLPEHVRDGGWGILTDEADELIEQLVERSGHNVPFALHTAGLFPIDADTGITLRDILRSAYRALQYTHIHAAGTQIRQVCFRKSSELECYLEEGTLVLPVVVDENWGVESIWVYEIEDVLNRLVGEPA